MKKRIEGNKDKIKEKQCLVEHPFGTIKRSFNQGYMLMKGIKKVGAEMSLTILAYNVKRVINIIGLKELIASLRCYSVPLMNKSSVICWRRIWHIY